MYIKANSSDRIPVDAEFTGETRINTINNPFASTRMAEVYEIPKKRENLVVEIQYNKEYCNKYGFSCNNEILAGLKKIYPELKKSSHVIFTEKQGRWGESDIDVFGIRGSKRELTHVGSLDWKTKTIRTTGHGSYNLD